jgi:outer membrane protein assembly factor BamE (lipoprotein component of BamABCDE complex)
MILRTTLNSVFRRFFQPDYWLGFQLNFRSEIAQKAKTISLYFLLTTAVINISACASWLPDAHRIDLQQGNTIKLEQLESIEVGMTKSDVRKIMGSPMLSDPFHNQRWDYIYRFVPNKGFERKSLLTLYFENDVLIKIDDSEYVEP